MKFAPPFLRDKQSQGTGEQKTQTIYRPIMRSPDTANKRVPREIRSPSAKRTSDSIHETSHHDPKTIID